MKYSDEQLRDAVSKCKSVTAVCRYLGVDYISGGMQAHISRRIKKLNLDLSHFTGQRWNKGRTFEVKQLKPDDVLVYDRCGGTRTKRSYLKRALIQIGRELKCEECSNEGTWNSKPLVLQIDHRNGDPLDNRRENLRFLCPNCHSQTPNFGRVKARVPQLAEGIG